MNHSPHKPVSRERVAVENNICTILDLHRMPQDCGPITIGKREYYQIVVNNNVLFQKLTILIANNASMIFRKESLIDEFAPITVRLQPKHLYCQFLKDLLPITPTNEAEGTNIYNVRKSFFEYPSLLNHRYLAIVDFGYRNLQDLVIHLARQWDKGVLEHIVYRTNQYQTTVSLSAKQVSDLPAALGYTSCSSLTDVCEPLDIGVQWDPVPPALYTVRLTFAKPRLNK